MKPILSFDAHKGGSRSGPAPCPGQGLLTREPVPPKHAASRTSSKCPPVLYLQPPPLATLELRDNGTEFLKLGYSGFSGWSPGGTPEVLWIPGPAHKRQCEE